MGDENALEISDVNHSEKEERWVRLGVSSKINILCVVFVEKVDNSCIRIISARKATRSEEIEYIKRLV